MQAGDVLAFLDLMDEAGIPVWIDGGWGVDALLGEQTRPHDDLDIALRFADMERFVGLMDACGYRRVQEDGPYNFVLEDEEGRQVDVHIFDDGSTQVGADRVEVYGPNGLAYEVGSLDGQGTILGRSVACCTVEFQVKSHTGYELDENDERDVMSLHHRFGVALPPPYGRLAAQSAGSGCRP
jgi:lincosamide nucleotidyltransferase A/C/D/E